ncbi:mitochondrial amidoxime reducing component 2-like [Stegodyphus dumicola]|uniref:mitochondrial amidoxime reducing component 2-like n=1 Tax=Stegodyphus dumicola TaxID=202533 RepID=UPI0015B1EC98|nr:mitochondrial amidoxime reducing component 2-like [Stegodyphus dumicola]
MSQTWKTGILLLAAVALSAAGILIWKKKKRSYVKVGKIAKILFYPVKSMKGFEITEGKCTGKGLEVNGLLDRSFMLIGDDGVYFSHGKAPLLSSLPPPQIQGKYLIISKPSGLDLKVEIKDSPTPGDKLIECRIFEDSVKVVDCGDEAAAWFQEYLETPGVRLVRYFPSLPPRKYLKQNPYESQLKAKHPIGLQNKTAIHLMSQASIDDLNSRIDGSNKVSFLNFKPNILVEECGAYDEDSWKYMKFNSGVELMNWELTARCLQTTINPDTGVLTSKEPLVTLRKYRIPKDPEVVEKIGARPCLGIRCIVLKSGNICLNEDILGVVSKKPLMKQ